MKPTDGMNAHPNGRHESAGHNHHVREELHAKAGELHEEIAEKAEELHEKREELVEELHEKREELAGEIAEKREEVHEKAHEQVSVHGHTMERADVFKFAGLAAFIVIMAVVVVITWPYLADLFNEGGLQRLVERMQSAGPLGVFLLLGMQFLQIIVAFIPGEVVQLAAGLMYGPWLGSLIILVGCVFSSAVIYQLVHKLGAPFVQGMVSTEHLEKFKHFEQSGKLDIIVFILFLIPGMPKDVFTYIVPLTSMEIRRFLTLTTIGRIPGVVGSTYAANGFANGDYIGAIVILAVLAVIAIVAIVFHKQLMDVLSRRHGAEPTASEPDTEADGEEGAVR